MTSQEAATRLNVSVRSFLAYARWNGVKKLKSGLYSPKAVERLAAKIAARKGAVARGSSPAEA